MWLQISKNMFSSIFKESNFYWCGNRFEIYKIELKTGVIIRGKILVENFKEYYFIEKSIYTLLLTKVDNKESEV